MKFSMNGFRKSLNQDLIDLKIKLERVVAGKNFDADDLKESFNVIAQHSNVLNCVYDNDDEEFSDLSDLVIEYL